MLLLAMLFGMAAANATTYTPQKGKGETATSIAKKFGMELAEFVAINNLGKNPNRVLAGTAYRVKDAPASSAATTAPAVANATMTVQAAKPATAVKQILKGDAPLTVVDQCDMTSHTHLGFPKEVETAMNVLRREHASVGTMGIPMLVVRGNTQYSYWQENNCRIKLSETKVLPPPPAPTPPEPQAPRDQPVRDPRGIVDRGDNAPMREDQPLRMGSSFTPTCEDLGNCYPNPFTALKRMFSTKQ